MSNRESLLGGVSRRLWRWICGCSALIVVDMLVYGGLFWVLKVPYFPVFGVLSGLAVLLPGIGIVLVALLTLTVCALHGVNWWQLTAVALSYLIYGGVIEQFMIYPALVGGALGLTAKESLLAIVIGVCVGSVPGMLFALPVASVIKFIWVRIGKGSNGC